ncbi:MAG: hypothetical protein QW808_00735 [Desulfurococcaceae archaeon]
MKVFCVGKNIEIFHTGVAAYLRNDKLCISCNFIIPPLMLLPEFNADSGFTFDPETYPPKIVLLEEVDLGRFISIDRSVTAPLYYVFKKVNNNSYVLHKTSKTSMGVVYKLETLT